MKWKCRIAYTTKTNPNVKEVFGSGDNELEALKFAKQGIPKGVKIDSQHTSFQKMRDVNFYKKPK